MLKEIHVGLYKLKAHIEIENYKGYDPYDALKSPVFKLPLLNSNKLIRFGAQQMVKRLPFNIRPLLFISKGYNPVTLGLCIQGYAYLCESEPSKKNEYVAKIIFLVEELKKLIPPGFSGACWGYDFDWEARHAKIPAYQPTVVATGIITNALFIAYKITGLTVCGDLVVSAADFVLKDLNRSYDGETLIFSYSPFDHQKVFNASIKGVRLLAQSYNLSGNTEYKLIAARAVSFIVQHQNPNGSWYYSLFNSGGWIDNYHTGYILDCLDEYSKLTGSNKNDQAIHKGIGFYKNHFITQDGIPKFYHDKIFPIDCTAASQCILTLLRFNETKLASDVGRWMTSNMQAKEGYFYFRKYENYTEKTSFMRWSNAWMFAALSFLQLKKNT